MEEMAKLIKLKKFKKKIIFETIKCNINLNINISRYYPTAILYNRYNNFNKRGPSDDENNNCKRYYYQGKIFIKRTGTNNDFNNPFGNSSSSNENDNSDCDSRRPL